MFNRAVVLLVFLISTIASDAQVVGGTISGTILDAAGAVIPGAYVTIHNQETGGERHLLSNADGAYSAPSIPVGVYAVSVTRDGFAPQTRIGVSITVGQATRIDLTLHAGNVSEQITVTDAPSSVNLSTQQISGLVDERQVKELPLNGRSYDQLITLNPATVNYTGQRSGSIGTSNSSVGNMFAISGRRPQDNLYLLNGVEYTGASLINVTPGGTSGQLLGVDAVREFNVVTDTYSASYGKRQGAQISIVTASGTNTAARLRLRVPPQLRSSTPATTSTRPRIPEFQRNNFGALARRPHPQGQALPLRQLRRLPPEPRPLRRHPRSRQRLARATARSATSGSADSALRRCRSLLNSGPCRTAPSSWLERQSHRHR